MRDLRQRPGNLPSGGEIIEFPGKGVADCLPVLADHFQEATEQDGVGVRDVLNPRCLLICRLNFYRKARGNFFRLWVKNIQRPLFGVSEFVIIVPAKRHPLTSWADYDRKS